MDVVDAVINKPSLGQLPIKQLLIEFNYAGPVYINSDEMTCIYCSLKRFILRGKTMVVTL